MPVGTPRLDGGCGPCRPRAGSSPFPLPLRGERVRGPGSESRRWAMCETSANLPQEQAEALLQQRLRGRLWELRVVGRPGGVILQGRALDYHTKQLGQHIAMRELRLT